MSSAFSHSLRILTCAGCGAPVEVDLAGGRFGCSYCGAENHLSARDEARDLVKATEPLSMSEMERVARLRDQESLGDRLPASLRDLVDSEGRLWPNYAEEAKRRWLAVREELARSPSFSSSEQLFFLTVLLVPHGERRQLRAFLETAIELLPDDGHRHILRCHLARLAVGAGEPEAAEEWLAACHPRPLELHMDTAYRLAVATLATAREDYQGVLAVLGEDTPLVGVHVIDCALLRVHALDRVGRREEALSGCDRLTASHGPYSVEHALQTTVPSGVGAEVYLESLRREKEREVAALERRWREGRFDRERVVKAKSDEESGSVRNLIWMIPLIPPCTWWFLFMGGGETGDWQYGPLSGQPTTVWVGSLLLALLLTTLVVVALVIYAGARAKAQHVRSRARAEGRLRAELDAVRLELQQLERRLESLRERQAGVSGG